jgi:hypothetical protein
MTKQLLLILGVAASIATSAQSTTRSTFQNSARELSTVSAGYNVFNKVTADGDTLFGLIGFPQNQLDSLVNLQIGNGAQDSGYVFGPNFFGDQAWAERFDFSSNDSGYQVIGTFAIFDGDFNPSSLNTIQFKVWNMSGLDSITKVNNGVFYWLGFPNTVLATSPQFLVSSLGINQTGDNDTMKAYFFPTPSPIIYDSFFVGYQANFSFDPANSNIGLKSTRFGYAYEPGVIPGPIDTVINVKNATQYSDGVWHSNWNDAFNTFNRLAIFPIVVVKYVTGVHGITKGNLEFFGSYPNPASTEVNVRFALSKATTATISVMDMSGKVVFTQSTEKLSAGEHVEVLNTSALPAGNYVYLLKTGLGDGMGSQFSVIK